MSEVLLARHAKSFANVRDVSFGNMKSPLNTEGVQQAREMNVAFRGEHDITPEDYSDPVAASEFVRPQQTAHHAGFQKIHIQPILNEPSVPPKLLDGRRVIAKHAQEGWIPEELEEKARKFVDLVREGKLEYKIYFTHGFFIASVLEAVSDEYAARGEELPHQFDPERGYIPRLATITPVNL